MKTKLSKKVLSLALATVMMFLFIPFSLFNLVKAEASLPKIDYTPFLIETTDDNKTIYNAKTADMLFDFYKKASQTIKTSHTEMQYSNFMEFETNGVKYTATDVYYIHPETTLHYFKDNAFSRCGMLACVLNYDINGQSMHTMLIAFKGTTDWIDWLTNLSFSSTDNGYHAGFYYTTSDHYERLKNHNTVNFDMGTGDDFISFDEYVNRMKTSDNYNMFVTGHSLGGAVANIFTKAVINPILGDKAEKSAVAYTFAAPLTGSSNHKNADNIFNLINNNDIVPKVGYALTDDVEVFLLLQSIGIVGLNAPIPLPIVGGIAVGASVFASLDRSYRSGIDLQTSLGCNWINDFGSFNNHHMSDNMYGKIKDYISDNISNYLSTFVLYSNYDADSHTHQTIIYNNGKLIVKGNGKLNGNWSKNTLTNWEKVKDKFTSLTFSSHGSITEIGDYAFAGMTQLQNELYLPDSLEKIGNYAFLNCGFDGDLIIPEKVEVIGNGAFLNCINLDSIDATKAINMVWGYGAFANSVGQHDLHLNVVDSGTDLAKVFKQYNVKDQHGFYQIDVKDAHYGNYVLPGDAIYIGRIKDKDLDIHPYYDFHYLLTEGHTDTAQNIDELAKTELENIASVDEFGCVTVSENCEFAENKDIEFTVVIMDNVDGKPDYDIYDSNRFIHFTIKKKTSDFAGGLGTEERPYLIKDIPEFITSAEQFDNIDKIGEDGQYLYLDKHFKLMNDIDFSENDILTKISTSGALSGGFDGNGYALYGFKIEGKKSALFNRIEEGAYVKNLTIGKEGDNASVSIIADGESGMKAAALAYVNRGIIENCSVINADISATASVNWGVKSTIRSYAAGLVADNYGKIENCHVESCTIYAESTTVEDTNPARCEAFSGGIVALNADGGKIVSSSIKLCTVKGYTKSVDTFDWSEVILIFGQNYVFEQGKGYTYCGGIVARSTSEIAVKDCYVYNNAIKASGKSDYEKNVANEFQADGNIKVENCKTEDHNCTTPITFISIGAFASDTPTDVTTTPDDTPIYKTNYFVGEELNLYGLIVRDSNNNTISNYTVEGFDNTTPGTKTVTIKYNTGYSSEPLTTTFEVTVRDIVPILVEVKAKDKGSPYEVNYTVTPDDLIATVYYNNGDVEVIESIGDYSGKWIKFSAFETLLSESTEYVITIDYTYTVDGVEKNGYASTLINAYCDHSTTELVDAIEATTTSLGYTGDVTCTTCHDIIEEGKIIDILYIPGDINNDGKVDNKDTTVLMKYFAGWDVDVNHNALDVNEDGVINTKDTTRLMQYIAGWNAFENTDNFNNEENWNDGVLYLDKHLIKAKTTVSGKLIIKDGTTSIANRAFENCNDVSVIIIPDSVIHIGENAFGNCANLKAVYYLGTKSDLTDETVNNVSDILYFYSEEHPTEEGNFWHWVDGEPTVWCSDIVIDEMLLPTCISAGLTEGARCITCGEVLVEQKILNAIDHDYLDGNCIHCGATSDEYFTFTLIDGTYWIKAKDVNNMPSDIVIPSTYNGKMVSTIHHDAFRNCTSISSVTIPDSINFIGELAFYNCTNLISVEIPNSATCISKWAFRDCSSLTNIILPDSVTTIDYWVFRNTAYYNDENNWVDDVLYIGNHLIEAKSTISGEYAVKDGTITIAGNAFQYCYDITSVVIPDTVTSIGEIAFYDCTSLESVVIGNNVATIGNYAFEGCSSLTSIEISDSVTSIGWLAFYNTAYYNDESNWVDDVLYIGNHLIEAKDTISGEYVIKDGTVTIADNAFERCENLTNIVIPDSIVSIGDRSFYYCKGLTSITIPSSVTSIGVSAFYGCSQLTSVKISDSVTSISKTTFSGCSNLTSIVIPDNVDFIGDGAFMNCSGLVNIVIPNSVVSIGNSTFSGCSNLTNVTIPDSVTSIGDYAFSGCSNLTNVTIPDSVTSIGDRVFKGCTGLTSVMIPGSVVSIGNRAFQECTSLTSVEIPNSVTTIGYFVFYNCSSLTNVTIPDSVISLGSQIFYNCTNLTSIVIPDSVTDFCIGDQEFYGCSSLTSVILPDIVTSIGDKAFYGCSNLSSFVIGDSVTTIGNQAFYGCSNLVNLVIGKNSNLIYISPEAFKNCTSLTSVVIPDSVTSIGWDVFSKCTSLTSVVIGDSVISIDYSAFYDCNSLTDVYYTGTEEEWAKISIGLSNSYLTCATRYYYSEEEPTTEGNFWHWGENGEIVVWE